MPSKKKQNKINNQLFENEENDLNTISFTDSLQSKDHMNQYKCKKEKNKKKSQQKQNVLNESKDLQTIDNQKEELLKNVNDNSDKIQDLIQQNKDLKKQIEDMNNIQQDQSQSQYQPSQYQSQSQYDLTIKINSVYDLQQTDISTSKNKERVIFESINDFNPDLKNSIIVGIFGFQNSHKYELMNELIEEKFPQDNQSTLGICLKEQKREDENSFVFLVSQGKGNPSQFDYQNSELFKTFVEKQKNGSKKNDEEILIQIENEKKKRSLDAQVIEQIQEGFVLNSSHIIIIVVSHLSQQEQTFITQISKKFFSQENNEQGKIIVVHNLRNEGRKEQISQYIAQLKVNFPLQERSCSFDNQKANSENIKIIFDICNKNIQHVILANKDSEAGKFYNNSALHILKHEIGSFKSPNHYHVKEQFQQYLQDNLQKYVTFKQELQIDPKEKNKNHIKNNKNETPTENNEYHKIYSETPKQNNENQLENSNLIQLECNQQNNIFLKKGILIQDFIAETENNQNCIYYIIKSNDEKEKYVIIEAPGLDPNFSTKFEIQSEILSITIHQNQDLEKTFGKILNKYRPQETIQLQIHLQEPNMIWKIKQDSFKEIGKGLIQITFEKAETFIELNHKSSTY